jgi:hypothetical protein
MIPLDVLARHRERLVYRSHEVFDLRKMSGFASAIPLGDVGGRLAPLDSFQVLGDAPRRGVVNGHEIAAFDSDFDLLCREVPSPAIVQVERADRTIEEAERNSIGMTIRVEGTDRFHIAKEKLTEIDDMDGEVEQERGKRRLVLVMP